MNIKYWNRDVHLRVAEGEQGAHLYNNLYIILELLKAVNYGISAQGEHDEHLYYTESIMNIWQ